ncbi:MAG: methyl-accepting chemotaxis protein [Magnetospirillum sp. WYHS-4]
MATSTPIFLGSLSVRKKLLVISSGFIAAIAGIMLYTLATISNQKSDGVVIDLAGRQRMLSQRYMKEVLLAAHGVETNHDATARIFDETLEALIAGGSAIENVATGERAVLPRATLPGVDVVLESQRNLSKRQKELTARLLSLKPGDAERDRIARELLDVNSRLLTESNELTKRFTAQAESKIEAMLRWEVLISLLAALLGLATAWTVGRAIGKPLAACVERAQEIAEGNLAIEPLPVRSSDEIGRLAASFNAMLQSLREVTGEIRNVTENLNAAGAEIHATSHEQTSATKEQAAAVQEITSTVEEINQSGLQVSDRARQVATAADTTIASSAQGMQAVETISRAMEGIRQQAATVAENVVMLSEKTQAIGEIIATVNDIAEQSNLVALNAAIEAADAREDGRRFSVVANEIKNLADQAKDATRQVRSILEEIQRGINSSVMVTEEAVKRVEFGREKVEVAQQTMRKMGDSIRESAGAFQQIVGATNQQTIGLEQVTQALHEIRLASQQTATSTGQLGDAVANLNTLGLQLRKLVEKYRI